jgi:hypothetical protein
MQAVAAVSRECAFAQSDIDERREDICVLVELFMAPPIVEGVSRHPRVGSMLDSLADTRCELKPTCNEITRGTGYRVLVLAAKWTTRTSGVLRSHAPPEESR